MEKNKQYICDRCHDKGYIDTGNNDLPCYCKKGLDYEFNVAGEDKPVSGRDLIIRDYIRRHTNQGYLD